MLFLKIFLVPSLIVAITLAGRRWGAAVAGCLAAFPVVAGPILFFVAIEHGTGFAARAAAAAILGVLGNVGFGVVYSWVSRRHAWYAGMLAGWLAYFCIVSILNLFSLSSLEAAGLTIVGLLIAGRSYPPVSAEGVAPARPAADLPYRVVAGLALVLAVTVFSAQLGAKWSGLFSVFPVMGSVLAVFSHRNLGQGFAVLLLQGMTQGFYAFTIFCLILAMVLEPYGVAAGFFIALTAAAAVQTLMMVWRAQRMAAAGAEMGR